MSICLQQTNKLFLKMTREEALELVYNIGGFGNFMFNDDC